MGPNLSERVFRLRPTVIAGERLDDDFVGGMGRH